MILHEYENKLDSNNVIALLDLSPPLAFSLMALLVKFAQEWEMTETTDFSAGLKCGRQT